MKHIFEELGGTEGCLVASKVADRVGITRSVIVNALRKFESAGVIESRPWYERDVHQGTKPQTSGRTEKTKINSIFFDTKRRNLSSCVESDKLDNQKRENPGYANR